MVKSLRCAGLAGLAMPQMHAKPGCRHAPWAPTTGTPGRTSVWRLGSRATACRPRSTARHPQGGSRCAAAISARVFDHSASPSFDGMTAYLAYWDAGAIIVDSPTRRQSVWSAARPTRRAARAARTLRCPTRLGRCWSPPTRTSASASSSQPESNDARTQEPYLAVAPGQEGSGCPGQARHQLLIPITAIA